VTVGGFLGNPIVHRPTCPIYLANLLLWFMYYTPAVQKFSEDRNNNGNSEN